MSINATLGSKSRVRRTIIELKWFSMICFAGKNKEACFMHARVAMYSLLLTRFLLKGVIYILSVIHIFRLSSLAHSNKQKATDNDITSFSRTWQTQLVSFVTTCTKMLRHYASRNLWRHALGGNCIVKLPNFEYLPLWHCYKIRSVLPKKNKSPRRPRENRSQEIILRRNREDPDEKTWLCSLQEPWTTPRNSRWEFFTWKMMELAIISVMISLSFFLQLSISKNLVLQNTELYNIMSKLKPRQCLFRFEM